MNIRNQLICAHSAIPFALLTGLSLFILTGWLPPPSPALSGADTVALFQNEPVRRVGFAIGAFVSPLFLGITVAIFAQLRRIEGEHAVLAYIELAAGTVGTLFLLIPAFIWLAISYRPLPPEVVMVFNDMAWFMLIGAVGTAVPQNIAIGLCVLGDKAQTVYPRWLGYWNLWLAVALMPGVLLPFFKQGPFAWNGLFGFWMVFVSFFAWVGINYVWTVKAIHRQRDGR